MTERIRVIRPGETEAGFERAIIDMAHYCGWRVAHFRPAMNAKGQWRTAMSGDPGFPDLVLARKRDKKKDLGRPSTIKVLFRELKLKRGKLSEVQGEWLFDLHGEVWTPDDWPEIERTLKGEV